MLISLPASAALLAAPLLAGPVWQEVPGQPPPAAVPGDPFGAEPAAPLPVVDDAPPAIVDESPAAPGAVPINPPPAAATVTPLEALRASLGDDDRFDGLALLAARPAFGLTGEPVLRLIGVRPPSLALDLVESNATDVLVNSGNTLAPNPGTTKVDASGLIVADLSTGTGVFAAVDALGDDLAGSGVIRTGGYDAARGVVTVAGVVDGDAELAALQNELPTLPGVNEVNVDGVVNRSAAADALMRGGDVPTFLQALGHGSGVELLSAAEAEIVFGRPDGLAEAWQRRAMGHLWNGQLDAAVAAMRVAVASGAQTLYTHHRFNSQGSTAVRYHRLWDAVQ